MDFNRTEDSVAPEQILYFMTQCFDDALPKTKETFQRTIEHALVTTSTPNVDYTKDLFLAWACITSGTKDRPTETYECITPNTDDMLLSSKNPTRTEIAGSLKSGNTLLKDLSYARYALCNLNGYLFVNAVQARPSALTTDLHAQNICSVLKKFSKDCTFRATGDWMIHSLTTLMCPAWSTAVLDGGQPPYIVASELHKTEFNGMLRPAIKTPLAELTKRAISNPKAETPENFVTITTLLKELAPSARVLFNSDIFKVHADSPPSLFFVSDMEIAGVISQPSYGILIGKVMHVYNGFGIVPAVLDWLLYTHLTSSEKTQDLTSFVFNIANISDSNPLIKYCV